MGNTSLLFSMVNIRKNFNFHFQLSLTCQELRICCYGTSYDKCWKNFYFTMPCAVTCIFSFLLRLIPNSVLHVWSQNKEVLAVWKSYSKKVLAFWKFYRKEVLVVLTSNNKEVLPACRIQAQATRKKPQEVKLACGCKMNLLNVHYFWAVLYYLPLGLHIIKR